ncbi:MAG TPA: hypothetical protein VFK68_02345 [Propionibacteriaceae bacterium]|nr:hypothetical protein [Propionibacteriaceae bacterium]
MAYLIVFMTLLPTLGTVGDDPTPLFAVLAGTYLVGAVLLLSRDNVLVDWVGVAIQVVLLAAYLSLTVVGGLQHPDPAEAVPFALRFLPHGIVVGAAQVLLVGVLAYLAVTRPRELVARRLGRQGRTGRM